MNPTLFQRLLGAEFYHLAPEVKALHSRPGRGRWRGKCTIKRGGNALAQLACILSRLPPSMQGAPVTVEIDSQGESEVWRREFDGVPMASRLRANAGDLQEWLGPMRFRFRLYRIDGDLHWIAESARIFGLLPLPASWVEEVKCRESAADGRYHFLVDALLPMIGPLIRYEGWLQLDEDDAGDA